MNTKKILLSAVCILAVAGISVMGTLAYLTDSTAVVNTFTMGNVDIKLDEANVDADGKKIADGENGAGRNETGNQYKLIPGKSYDKDPMVTVIKGSEESYIRMLVTINCRAALNTICDPQADTTLGTFFDGYDSAVWKFVKETEEPATDSVTYEFRYIGNKVPSADADVALEPLFTKFKVPGFFTGDDLAKLVDFKITVVGHAIQAEGFADADAAWAAFVEPTAPTNP